MTKKGIALTDLQMDWLRDNYATMTNAELAEALGVHPRSVGRYGKILGLKKDANLLRLESLRHLEIARRTPKEPSRMSAGHAKASRTMRKTWERERKRAACGLAQKTGLKVKRVPDWLYRQRSRLRRRGYRCMPDSRTAVITVHTQRLPELERMLEKRYQWRFINEKY
ncbi:MAG: hypothetical protein MJY60_04110 [Bacteroidales bacterium]|nr:hypothetical protein [Bacteroidales bacterium]